jgi:hypothetical protein
MQYIEGQGHPATMLFVTLLGVAMLVACYFGMLRPWPPGISDGLMFAVVAVIVVGFVGGVVWSGLRQSEIRIDRRTGEVTRKVWIVGFTRNSRWKLSDFHTAQVRQIRLRDRAQEQRMKKNDAFGGGPDFMYAVELVGPSETLRLQSVTDVHAAESEAYKAAVFANWQSKRVGYRIQVEAMPDGGRRTSITTADGEESVIGKESVR